MCINVHVINANTSTIEQNNIIYIYIYITYIIMHIIM